MTDANVKLQQNHQPGSARKPLYNPITFMWIALLGIPGFLIFMIFYKLSIVAQ